MIRNVIEDYLTSTKELQFFLPFIQLLEILGFYDIHLIHGVVEFGKDIIAKKKINDLETQYFFQIKVGDINLNKFSNEVKPQLLEAVTNKLTHPNFNKALPFRGIFVTTGNLLPVTNIAFQEFNNYLVNKINANPIETWEKESLISDFHKAGLEPFFNLHYSPEFISKFYKFYSNILNNENISFFEIEAYTREWLSYDLMVTVNRLQVLFETYFFSKLLLDKEKYYESALMVAALVRVFIRNNQYDSQKEIIQQYFDKIILDFFDKIKANYNSNNPFIDEKCIFAIFYHPISCLKALELLSLYILTAKKRNQSVEDFLLKFLNEQKGCFRVISDNYAISIILTSLALIKLQKITELKKYINNICVWLCDRYENIGLSHIGSTHQEEYEQLLSEYFTGLSGQETKLSFIASFLLDITYLLKDKQLYEQIANDLRAVEIIPEFFHVLSNDCLYT